MASSHAAPAAAPNSESYYNCCPDGSNVKPIKLPTLKTIPSPPVTEHEKMVSGELHIAFDQTLANGRAFAKECTHILNTAPPLDIDIRHKITQDLLGSKGEGVWIEPPFHCDYGTNLHIETGTFMNFNCTVVDDMAVYIGPRCMFGPNVGIYTATHPTEPRARAMSEYSKPVTIGADCWIGGGALILPGVTIGDCVVVGAGSVVNKDVPPYTVVAGNPARKIKDVPRVEEGVMVMPSK